MSKQPPKPGKGATPAEIKAWIAECQAQATPAERAEYEAAGEDLGAVLDRVAAAPEIPLVCGNWIIKIGDAGFFWSDDSEPVAEDKARQYFFKRLAEQDAAAIRFCWPLDDGNIKPEDVTVERMGAGRG